MFGPILIFDKSTLQSLNVDESLWLDNFYITNITPLFFIETLADLKKEMRAGKTPEQLVGNLAFKTPDTGCYINVYHHKLIYGELSGQQAIEMSGRPIISGGQAKKLGNETGIFSPEPPEVEAFKRWQKHQFLEVEHMFAKEWRDSLKLISSKESYEVSRQIFKDVAIPKTLEELKILVDAIVNNSDQEQILRYGLLMIGVLPSAQKEIITRWKKLGKKNIKKFAPYFSYILSIDLFFHLGNIGNLFFNFRHSQTHKIDLAYLYYLPFCKIFVSNDNFHINIVPLFLKPDQTFIKGTDFKEDLAKIDQYYSSFPEEIKNRGIVSFASIPPDDTSFLVTRLWDKYIAPEWRNINTRKFDGTDKIDLEKEKVITEKINKFVKEAEPIDRNALGNSDNTNNIFRRMVLARKVKWRRFPPEIENSKKRIF
jgi:hypothetical protein